MLRLVTCLIRRVGRFYAYLVDHEGKKVVDHEGKQVVVRKD
jgi:hypothetical protein